MAFNVTFPLVKVEYELLHGESLIPVENIFRTEDKKRNYNLIPDLICEGILKSNYYAQWNRCSDYIILSEKTFRVYIENYGFADLW